MRGRHRGQVPDRGHGASGRHDLLIRVPVGVAVACVLAVAAQLAVGWPQANVTAGAEPAQRHTASTPTPAATTTRDRAEPIAFATPTSQPEAALARYYEQTIVWEPCDGGVRDLCGTATVPVDYSKPDGVTVDIALRKVPALEENARRGTLFINPGGPGLSGLGFAEEATSYFSRDVRRVWDVVGFDPRGVGQSGGFACLRPQDLDARYAADPTPETDAEKAAIRRAARERVAGCIERGGELAVNMSSEHVAKDLDILRAVVGDTHLNYFGISYGTLIGALYADLFTPRVGLMVLDSAVIGDSYDDEGFGQSDVDLWAREDAEVFDDLFADYVAGCEDRGEGCPLGTNPDAAQEALVRLLDRLETEPLPTGIRSLPELTQGWAAAGLASGLYYPDMWADLDFALAIALEEDDGSELAYVAMMDVGREPDGTYVEATFAGNGLPVTCADWPIRDADLMGPSPGILADEPLWAALQVLTHHPCDGWTGAARETLVIEAAPATSILVIGNADDPITPIEATEALAETVSRARLVTVDAGGHGAYAAGNSCVDGLVDAYLAEAIAPRRDIRCAAE